MLHTYREWRARRQRERFLELPPDLRSIPVRELIDRAIRSEVSFKLVGIHLDDQTPDEDAARHLIAEHDSGAAQPWLAAYLLGCIGHDVGYDTEMRILEESPGLGAESYAGVAMVKIRGERAFDDLLQLMSDAPQRRGREGAAYGLLRIGSPRAAHAVLDAAVARTIHHNMGSSIAGQMVGQNPDELMPVDPARVTELLESGDERTNWIALEYLAALIRMSSGRDIRRRAAKRMLRKGRHVWLGPLMRILDARRVRMSPEQRETLRAWT